MMPRAGSRWRVLGLMLALAGTGVALWSLPSPTGSGYNSTFQRGRHRRLIPLQVDHDPVVVPVHQVADFLQGYAKGEAVGPTFRDALETQKVCDAVLASAKNRSWETV